MSRIGLQPVIIPGGVTVSVNDNILHVKGSKGEITQSFEPLVNFDISEKEVQVSRVNESRQAKSMHGLYRSLLHNMVTGVSRGFTKNLVINGVGYRAEAKAQVLLLSLGYSNPIEYQLPAGIQANTDGVNKVSISGIDRALVGRVAAEIRKLRPPEPYKGKGIRYENERIRRKVGKSGVK